MADASRTLTVKFLGDDAQLSKAFKGVADSSQKTEKHLGSLTGTLKKAAIGFAGFEAGRKAVDFLEDATKAAVADENAMTRTSVSVKNAGENWGKLKGPIDEALTKMSDTSGFMKSDLANAFSKLELATGNHTKALRLESDAENIAAQTGKPLQAVALALGKAYDGNAGALKRLGIITPKVTTEQDKLMMAHQRLLASGKKLTESQKEAYTAALKAAKIDDTQATATNALDVAHKKFADGVSARSQTMAGKMLIFNAQWENTKVQIGDAILPLLTKGMGLLVEGMNFLGNNKTVQRLFGDVQKAGSDLSAWVSTNWPQIRAYIEQAMVAIKGAWDNDLHPAFLQIEQVTAWLVGQIQEHWAAIQQIIEGVMTVIRGIIDVAMGLISGDWGRVWNGIKEILSGSIDEMKGEIKLAWDVFKELMTTLGTKALEGIKSGLSDLASWFTGELGKLPTAIKDAFVTMTNAASDLASKVLVGLRQGIGDLASWAGGEIGKIPSAIRGALSDVGNAATDLGQRLSDRVKSGVGDIAGAVGTLVGKIPGALTSALDSVGTAALSIGTKIVTSIGTGLAGLGATLASDLKDPINAVIGAWNSISFKTPSVSVPFGPKVGGQTIGVPQVPKLALGGIVPATPGGTLATIGEGRGPEAVIPLDSSEGRSILGGGGGGDTYITVNVTAGAVGDESHLARVVTQALITAKRRGSSNLAAAL